MVATSRGENVIFKREKRLEIDFSLWIKTYYKGGERTFCTFSF